MIVHVEDTGAGISRQDLPKLFSKFGKLHRTADMNHEGIGLGLTIVKQIVEKSDGHITAESEGIGKGSLFIFSMKMDMVDPCFNNVVDNLTSNGTGHESVGIGLKFDNTQMDNSTYKVPDAAELLLMDPNRS